jgi:hypothetical protein
MLTAPEFSFLIAINRITKQADEVVRAGLPTIERFFDESNDAGQWACLRHDHGYTLRPCTCHDTER